MSTQPERAKQTPRTATITFTELPGDRVSVKCEFLPDGAEETSAAHRTAMQWLSEFAGEAESLKVSP